MTEAQDTPAPLLKEIFDRARLRHLAEETSAVYPAFDAERFLALAGHDLDALSIMQRLRQIARAYGETLPKDFDAAVMILGTLIPRINHRFVALAPPEYVALFGLAHFETSMAALKTFTPYGTAEFAVRPFLRRDLARTLEVMETWTRDPDEHVRRLASEGSRPRLPWSFRLDALVEDPTPTTPILDALKTDDSAYVRKSVANHLNDITKDHPDRVLDHLNGWPLDDKRSAWIAKHALRGLIKQGDPRALALVGATEGADVRAEHFTIQPTAIRLGEAIALSTRLAETAGRSQTLVVDYAIIYPKASGRASRKVFKWKGVQIAAGQRLDLALRQTIKDFTTRKHAAGRHAVELLVNGQVIATAAFDLSI